MIDWIDFIAPVNWPEGTSPFFAGEVISTVPDRAAQVGASVEWSVQKRMTLEGSYSSTIQVKPVTFTFAPGLISSLCFARQGLHVSGNPVKWFQGHNIFGTDDISGLIVETLYRICRSRGFEPLPDDVEMWESGFIKLLRVDITKSYDLGTLARVRSALRSLDSSAHLRHRGRGHFYGDSITFGKGSRRSSLTLYAKGAEIAAKGHKLPLDLAESSLPAFANGLLRAEVRLRSMHLQQSKHEMLFNWRENTPSELHSQFMDGLQTSDAAMIDAPVLEGLPGRLQLAYQAWFEGYDLRATLPRPTFYRYRTELLKHGIDIAIKQERKGSDLSNVVPIRTVFHAHPVSVPDWAIGTPMYFEPRSKVA